MLSRLASRLSYANVMVTLLAFVVLGGGAYAAIELPKNSVRSRHIVNKQIKAKDLTPSLRKAIKQAGDAGQPGQPGAPGQGVVGWAVVDGNGTPPNIRRSQGVTGMEETSEGNFDVRFNQSVRNCSPSATQINYGAIEAVQAFTNADIPSAGFDDNEVHVQLVDNTGGAVSIDFNVQVFC